MPKKKKLSLTAKILIGMFAGIALGGVLNWLVPDVAFINDYLTGGLFSVVGDIFINSLKMIVVPLVLVSLICGTAALDDARKIGTLGAKTVGLYLFTTAIAITLALGFALLLKPGLGIDPDKFPDEMASNKTAIEKRMDIIEDDMGIVKESLGIEILEPIEGETLKVTAPPLKTVLVNIFPKNPFDAMAKGNMLQVIVFAVLIGIAITMSGESGKRVLGICQDLNDVVMKLILLLIELAPYGVFCLVGKTFATQGFGAIVPLAKYFGLVVFVLILHSLITYPLLLKLLSGLSPITFLKKMRNAQVFAFSTASSNATLPVTLKTAEERLGVNNSVASFTIPLGATINMDGTAVMQGVATLFIAQAYGIPLGFGALMTVILTATLASVGTAGVPSAGLIMLSLVLTQVGLPVEGIAIIWGIDRLLDMLRTAVNITGDSMVTCVVAKWEGELDETVFNKPLSELQDN